VTVSKPGFLNFRIATDYLWNQLTEIVSASGNYGRSESGKGQRALVEFVSANPTGPLTVGHGRQAVLGDVVARILEWNGYAVEREYYYNNAGRQMRLLGESVRARYLEITGEKGEFPEDGYEGEYIRDIAQKIYDVKKGTLKDENEVTAFRDAAEEKIFADIRSTVEQLEIHFDSFVNEQRFYDEGSIDEVVGLLREKGLVYDKEGAVWLKTTEFGKENDTVLIKSSGEPTYRLPDTAYHREKMERGYDLIVDIFGADHKDTYPDVIAAISALGYKTDQIRVLIHQFVSLLRDGKKVKMSTRKATFVTLDELMEMVGVDVVRYFFIMRNRQSHLNFDIGLAEKESDENPVYYLQYAHARICNILKYAEEMGTKSGGEPDLTLLKEDEELSLIKSLIHFPETVGNALENLEPQTVAAYLQWTATEFHKFYSEHRVVTDDKELTMARLFLVSAVRTVLANGLEILGISQPEKM
jgi:arginyl-tRNA synthetase